MSLFTENEHQDAPTHPRWLLVALANIGIHQVQSLVVEPQERRFRFAALAFLGLFPLTLFLPERIRGVLWTLGGLPPIAGAFRGHLLPIIRDHKVPKASETAPLNLAGGALLTALGVSIIFPSHDRP